MRTSALRAVAALVLLVAVAPAHAADRAAAQVPAGPEPAVLRVMTFNIHAGHGDVGRVAGVITAADPDVVALQEVAVHWNEESGFADQATELAEATGMEVRFGPIYRLPGATPSDPEREFGVAILSRLPVLGSENRLITRLSTQEEGPPRPMPGFLLATVDVGGHPVEVFSTHLDYRPDPAVRHRQVMDMLAEVEAASHPVLLMGDMNAQPHAPELQPLFAALTDTWGLGLEDRGTARADRPADPDAAGEPSPGYTFPADAPARRIDYVLMSAGFRVLRTRVVSTDASDHRPVVVELALTPG
ncbi:MAG: metal-dependent hydrolase [Gemmatimonadota bacterium]